MADRTSTSPPKKITIDGQSYDVRTVTQWKDRGRPGTIDDSTPPIVTLQYKPEGLFSQYITIANRTGNAATNNGWSFRPLAGPGFKKELIKKGPTSLSSQLDSITQTQLAKDAVVPVTRSQQALKNVTTTKTNQALAAANQDPTAAAGGQNQGQAEADRTGDNSKPFNPEEFAKSLGTDDRTRDNFKNSSRPLIYPEDLGKTKQDVIKFDMLKYKPKAFGSEGFGFGERTRDFNADSIGTVVLPIPSGISDTTSVTWGQGELDAAQAELAKVALSGITQGGEGFISGIEEAAKKVAENTGDIKVAAAAAFADSAVGVRGLLTRTTGAVINPNMELLFNAPTLRPFSFRFKMSARNKDEAQTIINIIRFFRQGMSPQRTASNIFLKSPHTFKIRYLHRGQNGEEHKYIGKIKECALQNFTVDYTPEGQYATFYDGVMVSYEINMQFTELEPVFNEDNDKNYGEIGF